MLPPREEPMPLLQPAGEFRDPELAARPKEKVDVDAGIDKNVIAIINEDLDLDFQLKMPSELLAETGHLLKIANDKNLEPQRELGNKTAIKKRKCEVVSDELQTKHNSIKN